MISLNYFDGIQYVNTGTHFDEYSTKVSHALIAPFATRITTKLGNTVVTGRGSHDLVESVCEYTKMDGPCLQAGSFVQKASGVKILIGGEHSNSRAVNITFSLFPVVQAELVRSNHIDLLASTTKGKVTIGHAVVIGEGVTILSGICIGNGAVIGAGSVVTKNIPAYSIAAGNPAKVLRYRFNAAMIEALERIRWWDWDYEFIRTNIHQLLSLSNEDFVSMFDGLSEDAGQNDSDICVVMKFENPGNYTILGVESKGLHWALFNVPKIQEYFDQGKEAQSAITVDPYIHRFLASGQ